MYINENLKDGGDFLIKVTGGLTLRLLLRVVGQLKFPPRANTKSQLHTLEWIR